MARASEVRIENLSDELSVCAEVDYSFRRGIEDDEGSITDESDILDGNQYLCAGEVELSALSFREG